MVALDAVGLLLADVELALRDQLSIRLPAVGAVKARVPALLQAFEKALAGSSATTAQLPVNELARSSILSLPHPELAGLFLR